MALSYQLSTSTHWEQLWSESASAQPVEVGVLERYYPIPEIVVPIQLENPIVAVYANSPSSPPNWKFAGRAFQKILTGVTVGGGADTYSSVKKIWLRQLSLLFFPKLTTSYALSFQVPYWIRDIDLVLWHYTGPVVDSVETKLDQIQADLMTLQNDFDAYTGM